MGIKIAIITPYNVRCGIATYNENLISALAEQDVDVYVVRLNRFGRKTPETLHNLVQKIPVDKIDLIHIQHEYGLYQHLEQQFYLNLKALGKPIITTMHAVGVRMDTDNIVASTSDCVIVHNKFCAKKFGYPEKTVIIPHGANTAETVDADKAKKSWGIDPRIQIVGTLGFVSEYKGISTLIEAMVKVPKAALLIAGGYHTEADTPYIASLKQKSLDLLPSRCQWIGYVPDDRLSAAYSSMNMFVYPAIYASESGALIMGLAHGKATIASKIPPFMEKEKEGALITSKGVKDLTMKIKRLLKDDVLRQKLEEGARRWAYENRWEVVAEKHIKLYEEVLDSKKNV